MNERKANTQELIALTAKALGALVVEKNKRYGDSAMNPLHIFSKHVRHLPPTLTAEDLNEIQSFNQILTRLDDKLKRIQNGEELLKNDVADVMGYLVLLCVRQGWTNFDDLID
jgi:hypothetical protein